VETLGNECNAIEIRVIVYVDCVSCLEMACLFYNYGSEGESC